jgi:hypothetical protein
MKKQSIIFSSMLIIGILSAYCVAQELIIKPKTKKSYVSQQQDIELDGELVVCGTRASGVLIELSKAMFLVTQMAVNSVNEYACGEKDCLGKVERTEKYAKKAKIKEKIEKCIEQIQDMLKSLNALIEALGE